jgi:hypothetical protein
MMFICGNGVGWIHDAGYKSNSGKNRDEIGKVSVLS